MTFLLAGMLRNRLARRLVADFRERRWQNHCSWQLLFRYVAEFHKRKLRVRGFLSVRLLAAPELHHRKERNLDRHRRFDGCVCSAPRCDLRFHVGQNHPQNKVDSWSSSLAVATKPWSSHQPVFLWEADGGKCKLQTIRSWARIYPNGNSCQKHQHLSTE